MFKGVFTALITPFTDHTVDEAAFTQFVEWQIAEGIDGLVPCGTTGESPTLSHEEHNRVTEICVEVTNKRVPILAGAGSNSTAEAIEMAAHAKSVGVDGILVATPYYNKPTQEGLYRHFMAIADSVEIPMVLYNIPGRSVVDLSDRLIAKLAKHPNIVGIKDATGDLSRPAILRHYLAGNAFTQLSGEDMTALAFNVQGGEGCISVTANIAPALCKQLQDAFFASNIAEAFKIHEQLVPLHQAMFCETSPGPVKYAASLRGLAEKTLRLPLVEPSADHKIQIKEALSHLSLGKV